MSSLEPLLINLLDGNVPCVYVAEAVRMAKFIISHGEGEMDMILLSHYLIHFLSFCGLYLSPLPSLGGVLLSYS